MVTKMAMIKIMNVQGNEGKKKYLEIIPHNIWL